MPKRILAAVLTLLFALYALPAAQAGAIYMSVDGQIVRIGKDGFICADNDPACSTLPAADILWAQDNRVVYTTPSLQGGLKLVCETLGRRVATYADNIAQAVYCDANGLLYYISAAQPNVLYRCAPQHGISSRACMTPSNILQITPSLDGLLILCEGEQGEPAAWLLPADQSQPELAEFLHEFRFEGCAVQVNLEGEMHLLFDGMPGVSQYAGNDPAAVAMYGNALYYTKNTSWGGYTQLYSFRTDTEARRLLTTLREPMTGAIAANDQTVFLISTSGTLIAVDAATGKQQLTTKLASAPVQPQLYLMEDTLYIYGTAENGCTALQEAYGVSYGLYGPVLMPLFTAQPEPTPTPTPAPTPAPTPTPVPVLLKRGMRGDDVRLMQEALIELGYLDDKADGSFGSKTLRAVKLFQEAADLPQTGMVDNAMLDLLYADNAPVFDLYAPLMQGDIGLRVRDLQQQLYDHGYLAEVPDGEYGPNTASAVRRLQEELGLRQTGDMSATCMEYVYNGRMPYYSGYISLRKGSTGPRVNELQSRLQALGYPVNVTGVYDEATYSAVCLFEQIVGASQTGRAGVNMQKLLFSESAPVYTPLPDVPVITPEPIVTPEPVIVTPEPVDPNVIGPGSPYEQMLDLQQKLFALGKITAADVTGQYNTATKYAIGTIQIEMRDQHGYSHIRSTGRADLDTQAFINDLYANMPPAPVITPAPEPEPEPAPQVPQGDVINGNSSPDVVFPLQQKLFALGYMTDPQSVSGRYDEETKNCVYFFQRDLNQYFGQNIALTGHIDPVTRQFIEDLYAQKDPSQLHMQPVLMAPQLQALADMLTAFERELSPNSDKIVEPLDAVKWAQNVLKKWGYYPQEYIPDSVYDQDVFNVIAALRADLCLNDPALTVDPSIAGVIDQPLFEYFKQMHLTDPSAIPEGCILRYKIW